MKIKDIIDNTVFRIERFIGRPFGKRLYLKTEITPKMLELAEEMTKSFTNPPTPDEFIDVIVESIRKYNRIINELFFEETEDE